MTPPAAPTDAPQTTLDAPWTIERALRHGIGLLAGRVDSPRLDAEVVLAHLLHLPRSGLIARADTRLAPESLREFLAHLDRRRAGIPVAYLTGRREFWSLELAVTPAVLVPRPETETLVEAALDRIPRDRSVAVLDLGTGSGAIALAIASERALAHITAVDRSTGALDVARRNGSALGLTSLRWLEGSWFDALPDPSERFDLIASNPPYVAAADPALAALGAEPLSALTPGATGFEALDHIIAHAPGRLVPGGWLLLEHGATQAARVATTMARAGFSQIESLADAAGLPRVTLGSIPTKDKEYL